MHSRVPGTLCTLFLTAVTVAATLIWALPAAAQGGPGRGFGLEEMTRPQYGNRDLVMMGSVLGIDQNQRDLIQIFLDDYRESHTALVEEQRAEIDRIRERAELARQKGEDFDWRAMVDEFSKIGERFQTRAEELNRQFVTNAQSVLLNEQLEQWPEYERFNRRQTLVPRGLMAGEKVDLFLVVESAGLDQAQLARIQPLLEEYAVQLDVALQQREADMPHATEAVQEAFRSFETSELLDAIERQRRLRVRIRDINEQYAMQIEQAIAEPDARDAFTTQFRETAYPNVYGETDGQKIFAAVMTLDDLTDAQRVQVEGLSQQFELRLDQINGKLLRVVREEEPRSYERMVKNFTSQMNGERINWEDPMREAYNERSQFEAEMITRLHALLTDDQVKELPRRQERPRGRDFGGARRSEMGRNRGSSGGGR